MLLPRVRCVFRRFGVPVVPQWNSSEFKGIVLEVFKVWFAQIEWLAAFWEVDDS